MHVSKVLVYLNFRLVEFIEVGFKGFILRENHLLLRFVVCHPPQFPSGDINPSTHAQTDKGDEIPTTILPK